MPNDPPTDTPVVVLVLNALATTVVDGFSGDHDLVVVIFVAVAADSTAARGSLAREAAVFVHAGPPFETSNLGCRHAEISAERRDLGLRRYRAAEASTIG